MAQARAQRQEQEQEGPVVKDPNVIEQTGFDQSMRARLDAQEQAWGSMTSTLERVEASQDRMSKEQSETSARLSEVASINASLLKRISALEDETEPVSEKVKENAKEAAEKAGNIAGRTFRRVRREVKPGPVRHDHLKGAILGGLGEYAMLYTAAQLWPVQTLTLITRALSITV